MHCHLTLPERTQGLQAAGCGSSQLSVRAEAGSDAELRDELVKLARQEPRYGYRRLHAVLERRGHPLSERCWSPRLPYRPHI